MDRRGSAKIKIIILTIIFFVVLTGGFTAVYYFTSKIETYRQASVDADVFFRSHVMQSFVNRAVYAEPYHYDDRHEKALYIFEAPEGFTLISHSKAWDEHMLELLYYELLQNEHGDEISLLYEIVVYPYEDEEGNMLASYTFGTKAVSLFIQFPAFPAGFGVYFPQDI